MSLTEALKEVGYKRENYPAITGIEACEFYRKTRFIDGALYNLVEPVMTFQVNVGDRKFSSIMFLHDLVNASYRKKANGEDKEFEYADM